MNFSDKSVENIVVKSTIEVNDLCCPLPLLKTKKKIAEIETGEVLKIVGLQPSLRDDLIGWCRRNGHFFLEESSSNDGLYYLVRKG